MTWSPWCWPLVVATLSDTFPWEETSPWSPGKTTRLHLSSCQMLRLGPVIHLTTYCVHLFTPSINLEVYLHHSLHLCFHWCNHPSLTTLSIHVLMHNTHNFAVRACLWSCKCLLPEWSWGILCFQGSHWRPSTHRPAHPGRRMCE